MFDWTENSAAAKLAGIPCILITKYVPTLSAQ